MPTDRSVRGRTPNLTTTFRASGTHMPAGLCGPHYAQVPAYMPMNMGGCTPRKWRVFVAPSGDIRCCVRGSDKVGASSLGTAFHASTADGHLRAVLRLSEPRIPLSQRFPPAIGRIPVLMRTSCSRRKQTHVYDVSVGLSRTYSYTRSVSSRWRSLAATACGWLARLHGLWGLRCLGSQRVRKACAACEAGARGAYEAACVGRAFWRGRGLQRLRSTL